MGPDGIPADCWKSIGDFGMRWLTRFMNRILKEGKMPNAWRKSEIVLIYKGKGDVRECGNYRGIKLLSHTMKLYEKMLDRRWRECIVLNESQFGFVPACSTAEPIFALRMLFERHYEFGNTVVAAFLDMEKAYDRTPRGQIWRSLRDRAVPERYIDLIRDTYEGTTAVVRTSCGTTDEIPIQVGVHQGSALSPLLFITVLDSVLEGEMREAPWTMMYADDICIAGTDVNEVEGEVRNFQKRLSEAGLTLNTGKTEFIGFGCGNATMKDMNQTVIKRVEKFKYLGSMITVDGTAEKDMNHRIKCAWMKWRACAGVMNDRRASLKVKGKVYKSIIRPALLYGSESWPITEIQMDRLMVVELKMLRWACGLTLNDRVRNEAIRAMTKCAMLNGKIRERRLRWFGHVKRRDKDHVCMRMMRYTIKGKRPVGRPKLRWSEMLKDDIGQLRLTERHALNRELWKQKTAFPDPV
jgi:hypothetical protein